MSYLKISSLILLISLCGCSGDDEEKSRKFVDNGNKYLAEDNKVAAKIEFTNALRLDKNSINALFELALIAETEKNWQLFEEYLKKVLTLQPEHIDARLKLTHFYIGSRQIDLAKTHSDHLFKTASDNIAVILARAAIYYKKEETSEGRKLVDNVLTSNPNNVDAIFLRANDHIQESEFKQALNLVNTGLNVHPDNLVLNMTKVQVLNHLNDWENIIPVYKHLMKLYPTNAAPPASLAQGYLKHGNTKEAINVLEIFANVNKNADFFINVVEIINSTQGADAAEAKLKNYIAATPELYKLKFYLADIYTQTNRKDLAYSEIEQIQNKAKDQPTILQAMNRLARIDLVNGNVDKTKQTIAKILKLSPKDSSAIALQSNLMIKDNKSVDAIKVLREALRSNPDSAELHMTLGRAHEQEKQWEQANESYARAFTLSPNNTLQTIYYAEFLVKRDNLAKAESLLAPLIASGLQNSNALKMYSHIMLSKQDWDEALSTATKMKAALGDHPEVAHLQGLAFEGKGDNASALNAFKHFYKLDPDSSQAMNLLVKSYIRSNQRGNAEKLIEEISKRNNFRYIGYLLKGNLYSHFREWASAESAFKQAIEADKTQFQGHDSLINVLMNVKQYQNAEAAINQALKLFPDNITFSVYLANLYQQLNQEQKSINIYQKILDKNPEQDVIANNLAFLLQSAGGKDNLNSAAKVADRFRQSKVPQYQDTLGWIYVQQKNSEEAEALLRKAAESLPEVGEVRYHLAIAFSQTDKVSKAKEQLEIALKLAQQQKISAPWVSEAKQALKNLNN